jgi:hypothetical protein
MKKLVIIFSLLLITSIITFTEQTKADANYTEVEFKPNVVSTTNLSRVTIGLYITPEDGEKIDTVATDLVTFSSDKLQFVGSGVSWGNLFNDAMMKLDGDVDNTEGTISNIIWGSFSDTSSSGYLYYMTFDVVGSGLAYVDVDFDELGIAHDGMNMPKKITSNCTFYISEIPTPPSVSAHVEGSTVINFTWTKGEGADSTRIEYSTNPDPWSLGEGNLLCENGEDSYSHTNLNPHTTYYYQFWSWNNSFSRYSDMNVSIQRTTLNNIPQMTTPHPNNDYASVYTQFMSVYVFDEDDDTMNIDFYWKNGSLIHTYQNASSDSTASIYIPDHVPGEWLEHNHDYDWYVSITDGHEVYTSDIWTFRTSMAPDINEDRTVNYLDVSMLVGAYLDNVTPGSIGSDINEDGVINYLDISSLIGAYLESY